MTLLVIALALQSSHIEYYLGLNQEWYIWTGVFSMLALIGLIIMREFLIEWENDTAKLR